MLAGLDSLRRAGEVELHVLRRRAPVERSMWLEIEDRATATTASVCLDLTDASALSSPRRTEMADLTWKRSHDPRGYAAAVVPFGLILAGRGGELHRRYVAGLIAARPTLPVIRHALAAWRDRPPPVRAFEAGPGGERRALFQVRAWAPGEGTDPVDRHARNEMRAELIRALRSTLGDAFVGGFVPTPYARATYPDCLAPPPHDPTAYAALVRRCRIGVSTAGLHASNPYKLAEYLAASRAIVTERLHHEIPDPLVDGEHIRTFDDVGECVRATVALLDDDAATDEPQQRNRRWWATFGAPDRLVRRRLEDLPSALR